MMAKGVIYPYCPGVIQEDLVGIMMDWADVDDRSWVRWGRCI